MIQKKLNFTERKFYTLNSGRNFKKKKIFTERKIQKPKTVNKENFNRKNV